MTTKPFAIPTRPAAATETTPRFRSGAVARMVRMPVATLRIWEQRYRVAAPALTPSGHRLYCAADVQRLALLKQLTELGHAIGSIAALSTTQLAQVSSTHAGALAARRNADPERPARPAPWRVVVVGGALLRRLQRPSLAHRLGRPLELGAACEQLAQVRPAPRGQPAALLLLHAPVLNDAALLPALLAAGRACRAAQLAVVCGYATAATRGAFEAAGVALLRETHDDRALAAWLQRLGGAAAPLPAASGNRAVHADAGRLAAGPIAPRRYDDAALTDFAGLSSTIACECPRHVAELLMQLSHFEAYSAECASRSPADAELHAYLQRVAGASRAMFEAALERIAIQEGLMLPS
jgi:MerR family transcriptional regulator, light-induced transcriptional regulator